ncbi:putative S-adenosyl-L-methionine-dependent methyltransferases superfamily protein [Hibiscus syriacus]|uniref:S-adenosyl-L-methionine-dependent methyltransferases superfamily protein n=1 Tax=Hibiscus syriacus TaxID=106335 RepID=A0A6A3BB26_HIBSY|nr:putative S-adenosyl-L-methionine-dependent methyltransferases superfamily protein [Hibiscus syriacus]
MAVFRLAPEESPDQTQQHPPSHQQLQTSRELVSDDDRSAAADSWSIKKAITEAHSTMSSAKLMPRKPSPLLPISALPHIKVVLSTMVNCCLLGQEFKARKQLLETGEAMYVETSLNPAYRRSLMRWVTCQIMLMMPSTSMSHRMKNICFAGVYLTLARAAVCFFKNLLSREARVHIVPFFTQESGLYVLCASADMKILVLRVCLVPITTVDDIIETKLERQFQLVMDKGTPDAIGLHPDGPIKRMMYWDSVSKLVAPGGVLSAVALVARHPENSCKFKYFSSPEDSLEKSGNPGMLVITSGNHAKDELVQEVESFNQRNAGMPQDPNTIRDQETHGDRPHSSI